MQKIIVDADIAILFHSGGHKSFAFINARLRILTPACV
jgi:hypothetical protein